VAETPKLVREIGLPLVRMLLRLTPYGVAADLADDFEKMTQGVGSYLSGQRTRRALLDVADLAAEKLNAFLQIEFPRADSGDVNASILAVGQVLTTVGTDTKLIIDKQLDPMKLASHMMSVAGKEQRSLLFSDDAQRIFDLLLEEVCNYLVEIATTQPDFTPKAIAAMLERGQSLSQLVEEVLKRLPARSHEADRDAKAAAFVTRYRRNIARRYDELEIFGADLERITRRYALNTAYVSLRSHASPRDAMPIGSEVAGAKEVEAVLANSGPRIVVWGEAGCGKTTLLQWAAVSAARQEFPEPLEHWNQLVPFVIRLRNYTKRKLPATEQLTGEAGAPIAALQPTAWCTDVLLAGNGLILIDGLDEVPEKRRRQVHAWLEALIESFPNNQYVITSRPAALRSGSHVLEEFESAWLLPMDPPEIRAFIRAWHRAVSEKLDAQQEGPNLEQLGEKLIGKVLSSRPLRTLTSSPLLCAVTCALHYSRLGSLPNRRVRLYEAALEMLLGRRDEARGVEGLGLDADEKYEILEDLAQWLVINGDSEASRKQVLQRIRLTLRTMPHVRRPAEKVLSELLERSGILREPVPDTIDFVHRTFQEFLASKALIKGGNISLLVNRSSDSEWHEVIVLASGHAPNQDIKQLLTRLMEKADAAPYGEKSRMYFLCVACIDAAVRVDPVVADRIRTFVAELVPPRSPDAMSSVIAIGDSAIPLLAESLATDRDLDPFELAYSVRALAAIGGEEALAILAQLAPSTKAVVVDELIEGWSYFDPKRYAVEVLANISADTAKVIELRDVEQLRYTKLLPRSLLVHCSLAAVPRHAADVFSGSVIHTLMVGPRQGLKRAWNYSESEGYDFLGNIEGLTVAKLEGVRKFRFLDVNSARLCGTVVHLELHFDDHSDSWRFDCSVLSLFPNLTTLVLHFQRPAYLEHFEDLPASLQELRIWSPRVEIYRWPTLRNLRSLEVRGYAHPAFSLLSQYTRLDEIRIDSQVLRDIDGIQSLKRLRVADLAECEALQDLEPLSKLRLLQTVRLCGCHQHFKPGSAQEAEVEVQDRRTGRAIRTEDVDVTLFDTDLGGSEFDWLLPEPYVIESDLNGLEDLEELDGIEDGERGELS
jgi:NACHT domain